MYFNSSSQPVHAEMTKVCSPVLCWCISAAVWRAEGFPMDPGNTPRCCEYPGCCSVASLGTKQELCTWMWQVTLPGSRLRWRQDGAGEPNKSAPCGLTFL